MKKTPKDMASLQAEYKKGYKTALKEVKAEVNELAEALRSRCNPNPLGNLKECLADAEIQAFDLVLEIIDKKTSSREIKGDLDSIQDDVFHMNEYMNKTLDKITKLIPENDIQ